MHCDVDILHMLWNFQSIILMFDFFEGWFLFKMKVIALKNTVEEFIVLKALFQGLIGETEWGA